jgi:hypothetical protein
MINSVRALAMHACFKQDGRPENGAGS